MAKRNAGRQLTDQNWDEEDEPEEAGVFQPASQDIIKNRVIKKAKRKTLEGTEGSLGAFKGFSGFGATSSVASPTFSFGIGKSKPLSGIANGSDESSETSTKMAEAGSFKLATFVVGADKKDDSKDSKVESQSRSNGKSNNTNKAKYLAQLRSLNESVAKWIKDHVDKNPYCILTPIFKDYEKHLADIEKLNPESTSDSSKNKTDEKSSIPSTSTLESKSSISTGGFSFTTSTSTSPSGGMKPSPSTPSFSLATSTSSASGFPTFNFKPATGGSAEKKPFLFATGQPAKSTSDGASQEVAAGGADEEYEPPKVEVEAVKEDDAFYTKRCKLFYQKEGVWTEKGVGNLYLKPCNGKTQLLMRADTNLGNILLNIMLNTSIPTKRQGKNNVSLICIPNPPIDQKIDEKKPVSMLIRVKTSEDADELLSKLEEAKKTES